MKTLFYIFITLAFFTSCDNIGIQTNNISLLLHCDNKNENTRCCKCPTQPDLSDSSKLVHIKNQFYKNNTGHLYEKTYGARALAGSDTILDFEYFSGKISQEVDPLTFKPIGGRYAKDKNYAYVFRPFSGGMAIGKTDGADVKSFDILQEHYNYAHDDKRVYEEGSMLKDIDPKNLVIETDDCGFVTKITNGKVIISRIR